MMKVALVHELHLIEWLNLFCCRYLCRSIASFGCIFKIPNDYYDICVTLV